MKLPVTQTAPDTGRPLSRPGGGISWALVEGLRPKQWTKNAFVFAALVFTNNIPLSFQDRHRWHMLGLTMGAFVLFCMVSGAVYLLNDVADRDQDRVHPQKRHRPVASGRLPVGVAVFWAVLLGAGGIAIAFRLNLPFGLITLGYFALQLAYTFVLKHEVLIDVFAIAAGFVLRAAAGALAISVPISVWLLICTLQLALFLGFGKRRHELIALAHEARNHRRNLQHYTVNLLDQMMAIVLAALVVCYAIYTIMSPTASQHPLLVITLVNVLYGVFRYLYLVQVEHKGGSPEAILMEDRPMQINLLAWIAEVLVSFKV
ncbi:MAG: decaprenyl-phosphate phosphoribosyltransferase [Chthonomonadales bacterium]